MILKTTLIKNALRFIGAFLVLVYVCFCIYYVSHSRNELLSDYLAKGGCFYGEQNFASNFFTDSVKQSGNYFCCAALPLLVLFAFYTKQLSFVALFAKASDYLSAQKDSLVWVIILLLICGLLSVYGHFYNAMCTDEAFSALNFARQPLVRLISYYPLPNNHIFFNFINHFFTKIGCDGFVSGRVISSFFYCLLVVGNFFLFRHFTKNNLISFCAGCLLALQFSVWGLGHHGRGYAICYFLEWGSFCACYFYFFSPNESKKELLLLVLICNVLGMWTVPTYLYILAFQLIAGLVLMVYRKQLFLKFWTVMLFSVIGTFLLYLPLFCYSGIASITDNGYVNASEKTYLSIVQEFAFDFKQELSVQSFGFLDCLNTVGLLCFVVPLILLAFRLLRKKFGGIVFLYAMLWLSIFAVALIMKRVPITRAMGGHMYFSLMIFLLLPASLASMKTRFNTGIQLLFCSLTILFAVRMFHFNREFSHTEIFHQDTKTFMKDIAVLPLVLDKSKHIWISDESFMVPFLLKDFPHVDYYNCNFSKQEIVILSVHDSFKPDNLDADYTEKLKVSRFVVYERK